MNAHFDRVKGSSFSVLPPWARKALGKVVVESEDSVFFSVIVDVALAINEKLIAVIITVNEEYACVDEMWGDLNYRSRSYTDVYMVHRELGAHVVDVRDFFCFPKDVRVSKDGRKLTITSYGSDKVVLSVAKLLVS